jgi:hypothetical protein
MSFRPEGEIFLDMHTAWMAQKISPRTSFEMTENHKGHRVLHRGHRRFGVH